MNSSTFDKVSSRTGIPASMAALSEHLPTGHGNVAGLLLECRVSPAAVVMLLFLEEPHGPLRRFQVLGGLRPCPARAQASAKAKVAMPCSYMKFLLYGRPDDET